MIKILAIALATHKEAVRSKILYATLIFAVLIVCLGAAFGKVSIGDPVVMIKDFALFSISIFCVAFCTINGALLLNKELIKKTAYNILSKPVSRTTFLLGKFIGLVLTATVLELIMAIFLSIFLYLIEGRFDLLIWQAYFTIWLELLIVAGVVVFFSSILMTPMLVGILSLGVFLAGRSSDYILQNSNASFFLSIIYKLLPHLDYINISNNIVYGLNKNINFFAFASLYSSSYVVVLVIIATLFFKKREL